MDSDDDLMVVLDVVKAEFAPFAILQPFVEYLGAVFWAK